MTLFYKPKLCITQAIKVTESDFFAFLIFECFTHNCRNEEINATKSDFFINIFFFVIQNFVLIKQ